MQNQNNCYKPLAKPLIPKLKSRSLGFTLIEIMIAMAIVSGGVVAVMTATASNADIASDLDRRLVASWVVSNQFAQIRHDSKLNSVSAGKKNTNVEMGGYQWQVRSTIEESDLERVFVVTIEAHDRNQNDDIPISTMTSSVSDKL